MKTVILRGRPEAADKRPDEADTAVQAAFVRELLEARGWAVDEVCLSLNLEAARAGLAAGVPDLVFNLVEAVEGRGDQIHLGPALLDLMGLPYTGCPQSAVYLSSSKLLAKQLMDLAGLPTPALWPAPDSPRPENTAAAASVAEPLWIVKSVWEHASLGLDADSVVGAGRVAATIARQGARYGGQWFAESYVAGREFNLSLLEGARGPEVLPPAEIDFSAFPAGKRRIVGYAAKWSPDSFEYANTPRRFAFGESDAQLVGELARLALAAWNLFGLRGYARVDFRVDGDGRPWILEVNANPCLSPEAGFMAAATRAGLEPPAVIERIMAAAGIRRPARRAPRRQCS